MVGICIPTQSLALVVYTLLPDVEMHAIHAPEATALLLLNLLFPLQIQQLPHLSSPILIHTPTITLHLMRQQRQPTHLALPWRAPANCPVLVPALLSSLQWYYGQPVERLQRHGSKRGRLSE
jgi:hypothetical protein